MKNQSLYIDPVTGAELSWEKVVQKITLDRHYSPVKHCKTFAEVFIQLIHSLVCDQPIVLFDTALSQEGVQDSDLSSALNNHLCAPDYEIPASFEGFLQKTRNLKNWRLTLFTSGTTGQPKKVTHNFATITRGVKADQSFRSHTWGWAYNPTHMAGVQVFFQAILNGNPLVMLFGLPRLQVISAIAKYQITHLSATPTFFRMLLPLENTLTSLKNLTFGGERVDQKLFEVYKKVLPNVRFRNIYASTEAGSLFTSNGDWFRISDKQKNLIKILDGELHIHHTLLGYSESIVTKGDWYRTNDIVEVSQEDSSLFRFVSRKNEMINVGGYKVNPHEIEEALNAMPGISNSRVYGKKNKVLGNIVMADVAKSNKKITETDIRRYLKENLQEFKIPRMISFVDTIELTRSGKNKRL